MTKMRNSTLDAFKIIACFMVIFIHSHVVCIGSEYWVVIARVAVPFFFMISGYYYSSIKRSGKEGQYFKKIIHLTLNFTLLYGLLSFRHLSEIISVDSIFRWIILNDIPFGGHLWYMYALIYVLLIIRVLPQLTDSSLSLFFSVFLIILNVVFSYNIENVYYRNFLFTGLPYFLIGSYVRSKHRITNLLSNRFYILGLIVILSLLFVEYESNKICNFIIVKDHYFMLYPLCILLFGFAVKNPNFNQYGLLSFLGKTSSAEIYLFHIIFISICQSLLQLLVNCGFLVSTTHSLLFPILVFLLTLFMVLILKNRCSLWQRLRF